MLLDLEGSTWCRPIWPFWEKRACWRELVAAIRKAAEAFSLAAALAALLAQPAAATPLNGLPTATAVSPTDTLPICQKATGCGTTDPLHAVTAAGLLSLQIASPITNTLSISSGNWAGYSSRLNPVECPVAGCTITLPQSTASVAPPFTTFLFQSLGPGLPTYCATTSSLVGVTLGLQTSGCYTASGRFETTYIESNAANNYQISPGPNPTDATCVGYVVGNGVTNLVPQPLLGNWGPVRGTSTVGAEWAPDCAIHGDVLQEDGTASATHYIAANVSLSVANATQYTFSAFAWSLTNDRQLWIAAETEAFSYWANAYLNLPGSCASASCAGTLVSGSPSGNGTGISATVTPYGYGVYKIALTWTTTATDTGIYLFLGGAVGGSNSYSGNGSSGIILFGGCLAQGPQC
jgi:hypothetical protein